MLKERENAFHQCDVRLIFLPPRSPELNSVDAHFGLLKCWTQKRANFVFPLFPKLILEVAMPARAKESTLRLCSHCRCENGELRK